MTNYASIRVLFLAPDTLQLFGIPYGMRRDIGQEPRHLWNAARKRSEALCDPNRYRGPHGPYVPPNPTEGWVVIDDRNPDDAAWLATLDDVPRNPCEWVEINASK